MNKKKNISIFISTIIFTLHVINRIIYYLSTSKNIINYLENGYYDWVFGKIHYIKKGSGTPLLLLHDLSAGSSIYEFDRIIDKLSKNYEVYSIDLLGYGSSDKPNITYTSYLYIQLINDFIKNIIGKKTNVIAVGDSSPLTIMTCHNNPEVFNKIILINPQSLYQLNLIPSKQTKLLKFLIDTPILGTFIFNLLTAKLSFRKIFEKKYFNDRTKIKEKDILAYMEASHFNDYNSKYSFSSYIGKFTNCNILHALKEINHSIFLISGENENDKDTIINNYLYYNNSIEVYEIPGAKHLPHMEEPEKLLSQIDIFLS